MTENETLKLMESLVIDPKCELVKTLDFKGTVIKALEDIQAYRAIGTVEEFKALKEKAEPKKVKKQENKILIAEGWKYGCPSCGCGIGTNERYSGFTQEDNYCPTCGQKLDWN